MMRSSYSLALALLVAIGLGACGDDGVALDVEVVTSLVPGPQFTIVETELLSPSPLYEPSTRLASTQAVVSFGDVFTRGRRVATFEDVATGELIVYVRLRNPDGSLLIGRRVRVRVSDNTVVRIFLTPDCVGVMCPSPTGSPTLNACFGGQCVDERCNPPNPEFCPAIMFCNESSDCVAPVSSCAIAQCIEGVCVNEARESACSEDEWCDEQNGCVPYAHEDDAGLPDAGVVDAEMPIDATMEDASMPPPDAATNCGTLCELTDDPCHVGSIDCSGEAPRCLAFATRPAGTSCGSGLVCDALGSCGVCNAGLPCTVGCYAGVTRCGAGYETCDLGAGTALLAAGEACSSTEVCYEGESCGSGETCSAMHVCELCTDDGAPCSTDGGCQLGTKSCAAGHVCVIDEIPDYATSCVPEAEPGEAVGAGFCDGEGSCVECIQDSSCALPSGCGTGSMQCPGNPYGFARGYCYPFDATTGRPVAADRDDVACEGGDGGEGVCNALGGCVEPFVVAKLGHGSGCGIRTDGSVACWRNVAEEYYGGTYWASAIEDVAGLPASVEVSGHGGRGCSVTTTGELWCWGDGNPAAHFLLPERAVDVVVTEVNIATTTLPYAACVRLESGALMCWGSSFLAGNGTHLEPTVVPSLPDVVDMDLSDANGVALRSTGEIRVWGRRLAGELGDGETYFGGTIAQGFAPSPVATLPVANARLVRTTWSHVCALLDDNSLQCWGRGVGVGIAPYGYPQSNVPQNVPLPFTDIEDFSVNYDSLCFLRTSGEVWCLGSWSELGRGTGPYYGYGEAEPVDYLTDVAELDGNCARTNAGRVYCWYGALSPYLIGQTLPLE